MRLSDLIEVECVRLDYDENLNGIETKEWLYLGKCVIMPNNSAKLIQLNDGKKYQYSYEVIMRKPKAYAPKENDIVHLIKKDESIDTTGKVAGFVTLRNWLKLWV